MAAVALIFLVSVLFAGIVVVLAAYLTSGASGRTEPPTVDGGWRAGV